MGKCWKDGETECDDMPNPDGYVCQEVCKRWKCKHGWVEVIVYDAENVQDTFYCLVCGKHYP